MKAKNQTKNERYIREFGCSRATCLHPAALVGKTMLIIGARPFDHQTFHMAVHVRLRRGMKLIQFAAGCVVEQQIMEGVRHPTWAKLVRVKSKSDRWYYKLELAETVAIARSPKIAAANAAQTVKAA